MRIKTHIIKQLLVVSILCGVLSEVGAQNIGINSTGNTPDASAALDIDISTKGLLIPRVNLQSLADATTISSPTTSLLVYNTGATLTPVGYYYWNGTVWVPFLTNSAAANSGWSITGNTGTNAGTNFIGTTDAVDWVVKTSNTERIRILSTGNLGIGTTIPAELIHVFGSAGTISSRFEVTGVGANDRVVFGLNRGAKRWDMGVNSSKTNVNDLQFREDATLRMVIQEGGNVGIGTTVPTAKLEVTGTGGSSIDFVVNGRMQSNNNDGGLFISSDRFVGGHSTNKIGFFSNSTWHLTVQSDGNVGIGTTSPISPLEIKNTNAYALTLTRDFSGPSASSTIIRFGSVGSTGNNTDIAQIQGVTTAYTSGAESGHLWFYTKNAGTLTEKMRIDPAGNVGIGTTSPTQKLMIEDASGPSIALRRDATNEWFFHASTAGTDRLGIRALSNIDAAERLTILAGGNIGIGTTTPGKILDANGGIRSLTGEIIGLSANSSAYFQAISYRDAGNHSKLLAYGARGNSTTPAVLNASDEILEINAFGHDGTSFNSYESARIFLSADGTHDATNAPGRISFFTTTSTSATSAERVRIDRYGNVGIGTSSPLERLHVSGVVRQEGNSDFKYEMYDSETNDWALATNDDADPNLEGFGIYNIDDAAYRLYIQDLDGNVGIGVTIPSEKLDVVGNFELNGDFNGSGTQNYSSDKRFKKDIKPLVSSLEKIKKVNGYSYLMRTDEKLFEDYNFDSAVRYGVIAQEIKEVFPELVKTDHKGYYSVNYDGLIPVLLEAIKEQQLMINQLRSENSILKQKAEETDVLKAQVEKINLLLGIKAEK